MFTYHSVNFTYSYTRGHAKYLTLARKLSSRFFYCILYKSCARHVFRNVFMKRILLLLGVFLLIFSACDNNIIMKMFVKYH